jgi:uncharacterized protein (TIGR03086 family)
MVDLEPATALMTRIVARVRDDQLEAATPCPDATVGALLDHVQGLCLVFTQAATKAFTDAGNQPPQADASRLPATWRTLIPQRLADLAAAWRSEAAWSGITRAGGIDLPAQVAGLVALNEVVVHGWYPEPAPEPDWLTALRRGNDPWGDEDHDLPA